LLAWQDGDMAARGGTADRGVLALSFLALALFHVASAADGSNNSVSMLCLMPESCHSFG